MIFMIFLKLTEYHFLSEKKIFEINEIKGKNITCVFQEVCEHSRSFGVGAEKSPLSTSCDR